MFDAGAIQAELTLKMDQFDADMAKAEERVRKFESEPHKVKLTADFDTASMGKARRLFADLDNQLSRDAANRLRSSPQGSVLGAINSLFSPHSVAGAPSAQQASQQGLLGKMAQGNTAGSNTATAAELAAAAASSGGGGNRRWFWPFGGGGNGGVNLPGGGGGGRGGVGSFVGNLLGGIGPGIFGLSARNAGIIGLGGSLLGGVPAVLGGLGALGVGGLGLGSVFALSKAVGLSVSPLVQLQNQISTAQSQAVTPAQKKAVAAQQASLNQSVSQLSGPLQTIFKVQTGISSWWQNFGAVMAPSFAKAIAPIPGLLNSLTPAFKSFFSGAVSLIKPALAGIGDLARTVLPLLGQAFRIVAPYMKPLIDGLVMLVKNLLTGLMPMLRAASPAVRAFASVFGTLGKDIGGMLAVMAPVMKQSAAIFTALMHLVGALLPAIGKLAAMFAHSLGPVFAALTKTIEQLLPTLTLVGRVIVSLAGAVVADLAAAFQALVGLLHVIAPSLNIVAGLLGKVFNLLENSGLFAILGNALESVVKPLGELINALVKGLAPIVAVVIKLISDLAGTAIQVLADAIKIVVPPLVQLVNIILKALAPILPPLESALAMIGSVIGNVLTNALAELLPTLGQLIGNLLRVVVALLPILPPVVKLIALLAELILFGIRPLFPVLSTLIGWLSTLIGWIADVVKGIVDFATNWKQSWADIVQWASDAWHFIYNGIGKFLLPLLGPAGLIALAAIELARHWSAVWGGIKQVAADLWQWLWTDFGAKISNFMLNTLPGWFSQAITAIQDVWSTIQTVITTPVKWVIDNVIDGLISAFDWISSKVGGPHINPVHPFGLSGGGRLPGYGGGDQHLALLESGETVIDKDRSRQYAWLFRMMGIPGYQSGGIIGDIWHGLTGTGKILAALATGNTKALSNAIAGMLPHGVGGAVADMAQLLTAIPRTLIDDAVHSLIGRFSGPGGAGSPATSQQVVNWIKTAMAITSTPLQWLAGMIKLVMFESGGNPKAYNPQTAGASGEHPEGIAQTIPSTFKSYGLGGSIWNPVADLVASMRYIKSVWQSVYAIPGILSGHYGGYDSGGWLPPGGSFSWNMTRRREAVLTPAQSQAFIDVAEAARLFGRGRGSAGGQLMRDVYLTLPEGTTVAQALAEIGFRLRIAAQQGFAGVPG